MIFEICDMWIELGIKNIVVCEELNVEVEFGWKIVVWLSCLIFEFFSLFEGSVKVGIFGVGFLFWILKCKFELVLNIEFWKKLKIDV